MNKEEAIAFFRGTELTFDGYYKFVFNYSGYKDGKTVSVSYGGDSSEIYREEFGPTELFTDSGFEYFSAQENNRYVFSEN